MSKSTVLSPLLCAVMLLAACNKREPAADVGSSGAARDPAPSAPSSQTTRSSGSDAPSEGSGGLRAVGTPAPAFSVRAHNGQEVSLSGLRGRVVVLYFYPKDGTPGCTVEAQQFSEKHQDLTAAGAIVLGVSSDSAQSHAEFAEAHDLPFLLLPDEDHALARAYGVRTPFGMTQRVTFIIDQQGVIARVYDSVSPKKHAEQILADLSALRAP